MGTISDTQYTYPTLTFTRCADGKSKNCEVQVQLEQRVGRFLIGLSYGNSTICGTTIYGRFNVAYGAPAPREGVRRREGGTLGAGGTPECSRRGGTELTLTLTITLT